MFTGSTSETVLAIAIIVMFLLGLGLGYAGGGSTDAGYADGWNCGQYNMTMNQIDMWEDRGVDLTEDPRYGQFLEEADEFLDDCHWNDDSRDIGPD